MSSKKLRLAINGFGRIGRTTLKCGWARLAEDGESRRGRPGVEFVIINDLTAPNILAHLLKYDSVFRTWDHEVSSDEKNLIIDGKKIPVVAEKEPLKLPWRQYNVDVVIECTGRMTKMELAKQHIEAGAKRVVISAPAKEVPTFLMGVNHQKVKATDLVINNASCTTNSVAPVAAILDEAFGVKKAMLTTVHSVTGEQNLVDNLPPPLHPDFRRSRSALVNIVPTSTGAAKAATEVLPNLKGLFDGVAVRVPTIDVSLSDFTFLLKKKTTVEEINEVFKKAVKTPRWKSVISVTDLPLVSSDFIGSVYSTVVDLGMTRVVDGDLVKIMAWYDNEWGYSVHLMDMAEHVGSLIK